MRRRSLMANTGSAQSAKASSTRNRSSSSLSKDITASDVHHSLHWYECTMRNGACDSSSQRPSEPKMTVVTHDSAQEAQSELNSSPESGSDCRDCRASRHGVGIGADGHQGQ